MLAPEQRDVLLELLRPPAGFQLDRSVGTTYSLDLDAALIAPLAFASFRLSGTSDPIAVMEAVRSAADRIDLFNQAGQIHAPMKASGLFAFLESVIHDAKALKPGHLFHPKVWFLRYVSESGERAARLLCLTRNLTNDASWDVALRLDGSFGKRNTANRPLRDFIAALPALAVHKLTAERAEAIRELAESAMTVAWEVPDGITYEPTFWPLGIGARNQLPDFGGYRHLVVAPFLNEEGLAIVASGSKSKVSVVSRVEDLDRLPAEVLAGLASTHIVNAAADLDDPETEGALVDRDRLHGLHAKFYVVESNRAASLFFGSANATGAAFGGNVEFLVELRGGAKKFGVDQFLGPDAGFQTILEEYQPAGGADNDPLEEALREVRNALRAIAELALTATVSPTEDGWKERIEGPNLNLPEGMTATVELLTVRGQARDLVAGSLVDVVIGPVALDEVTPFLLARVSTTAPDGTPLTRSTVVRAHLVNDPDDRLDEILARHVDTPEKFLRFLLLLLGLSDGALFLGDGTAGEGAGWSGSGGSNGLFELLVRAATDKPEVVDDLQRIVTRLRATERGRQALPDGFDDLWTVIEGATAGLQAVRAAGKVDA